MDIQQIVSLSTLISSSVQQLIALKLDKSCIVSDSRVRNQAQQITAAASQLISLVRTPEQYILESSIAYTISSSLNFAVEASVVEIIREKGCGHRHSLHVKEISVYNGIDDRKLARILRLLATHHIFEEISPDTFANNCLSAVLDTGKSITEIQARPNERYDGTSGIAALVGLVAEDGMSSAAFMSSTLFNLTSAGSGALPRVPFCRSRNTELTMFEWLNLPENESKMKRFGNAMNGMSRIIPADTVLRGFDWRSLAPGSVLIDVGGGVGAASLPIMQACPNIRLIIQDSAPVVSEAPKFWKLHYHEAIDEGRVSFQAQDFFLPQSSHIQKPAIFLVRLVMHNWPDSECLVILRNLRNAASIDTKLILVDNILMYACRGGFYSQDEDDDVNKRKKDVVNKPELEAPEPLLANWGAANKLAYEFDVMMMCNHDGSERTLSEVNYLLSQSGWAVQSIHQSDESWLSQIIAVSI